MSPLSTAEVASRAGIHRTTLELWIRLGKVKPKTIRVGKKVYRLWTDEEIAKVFRVKEKTYCKGRGRKKKKF
jgi:predicted site-specific integrase-resolvase